LILLGPPVSFSSEIIWNYEAYRGSIGFLGWLISPVARPLPTQENTHKGETLTDFHASSGIRTHDASVLAGEDISCLKPRGKSVP
jgi:hypothetical protein